MFWIYLPSSTDLKLCSDVPIVDFVDTWIFVTILTSRHLGSNIWVLANGSKMICQPLGHLLGPGSSHTGLGIWVFPMSDLIFMCLVLLEPGPKTQIVGIRQTYMLQCFECISLILNITHFGRMKPTIGHAFSIILFWHQMRESVFHTTNSSKNTGNFDLNKFTVL